jgi:hypothetical protein
LLIFCLLLAFWPVQSGRAAEKGPEPEPSRQVRVALPYGGAISRESAVLAAGVLARWEMLRRAGDEWGFLTPLRLGLDEPESRMALLDVVLPAATVAVAEGETGEVVAVASAPADSGDIAGRVRAAVALEEEIEMRAQALKRLGRLAQDCGDVIRLAAGARAGGRPEADYALRLAEIEPRLRAAAAFLELLDRSGQDREPRRETAAELEALGRADPDNPWIHLALAENALRLDRADDAVRHADAALRLQTDCAGALYVRGAAQLRLGLTSLAVADLSRALVLRPDRTAWWRERAAAYLIRHEYDRFCPDLLRACALDDCEGLLAARRQGLCLPGEDAGE